jgi:uncharacterized protein
LVQRRFTGFEGGRRVAGGALRDIVPAMKAVIDRGGDAPVLIFDDETGRVVDIDYRGTIDAVLARIEAPEPRRPGRPKLGVVAREVTLLPRHWDWLATQPGGASVALRKLVEAALRGSGDLDRIRQAQEAAYRFMTVLAGDRPGFEEAMRSLFAGDRPGFAAQIAPWPADIRRHAEALAAPAFI